MPTLVPSRSQDLHETNQRLSQQLDRMSAKCEFPGAAASQVVGALLAELMRTGAKLRAPAQPAAGTDPEFEQELRQYRVHVERLREFLPTIHGQLLAERERIEQQRTRLLSAAQWATASRRTL